MTVGLVAEALDMLQHVLVRRRPSHGNYVFALTLHSIQLTLPVSCCRKRERRRSGCCRQSAPLGCSARMQPARLAMVVRSPLPLVALCLLPYICAPREA